MLVLAKWAVCTVARKEQDTSVRLNLPILLLVLIVGCGSEQSSRTAPQPALTVATQSPASPRVATIVSLRPATLRDVTVDELREAVEQELRRLERTAIDITDRWEALTGSELFLGHLRDPSQAIAEWFPESLLQEWHGGVQRCLQIERSREHDVRCGQELLLRLRNRWVESLGLETVLFVAAGTHEQSGAWLHLRTERPGEACARVLRAGQWSPAVLPGQDGPRPGTLHEVPAVAASMVAGALAGDGELGERMGFAYAQASESSCAQPDEF